MPDPYTNPDSQPQEAMQAMITRLEERGRHPSFAQMIGKYAATLPHNQPLKVLDLGCGTGVVIRQLANLLHPSSALHGADVSEGLLREAKRLGPESNIVWDHLLPGRLPYADAVFDVVVMHTLLSHVPEPREILSEAKRILTASGRLIIFDADHAGTTYNQPDYETTRRFDALLSSTIAAHPDICRQMPRLLKATGLELTNHDSQVISECGHGDYWLSSVRGFARLLPSLGVLSQPEAQAWISHMLDSHADGTFFASGTFYTFYARHA